MRTELPFTEPAPSRLNLNLVIIMLTVVAIAGRFLKMALPELLFIAEALPSNALFNRSPPFRLRGVRVC